MSLPVIIESDALRIQVWPTFGGKVSSVVDKADNFELLFSYPDVIPEQGPQYDTHYAGAWHAAWDECIPSVAGSPYVGFPYEGIAVPEHGEIWGLPTTAAPSRNGITTVSHGLRFGYCLTRNLFLEGASLVAEYALVNLAPFEFRYVWSQHALLGLKTGVELGLDGPLVFRWSHDATGQGLDEPFEWPMVRGQDLSKPSALPSGLAWKVFSNEPISGPAVAQYRQRSRKLTIEYSSEDGLAAYWGIWINTGGWSGQRHFTLEPTTGRFDRLDRAIRDNSAARVEGLSKRSWCVRWTVSQSSGV